MRDLEKDLAGAMVAGAFLWAVLFVLTTAERLFV